ncbi:MAG: zinc ribbon domain-containing protein [Desulfobacterales bacterium]|nr:zinc ribbon domain-containing protein [Desulfobacterales bacterium]
MQCPKCGATISGDQNFCGGCGHQLKNVCSGCSSINPPFFKFCGQCGRNLADIGTVMLDRAGLMIETDAAASDLLDPQAGGLMGKPFALYIDVDDLVLYYSHWNELIRSGRRQNLEIVLRPTRDAEIHAQLVLCLLGDPSDEGVRVRMEIGDVSDRRQILQALQEKQDLLEIITSLAAISKPPLSGAGGKTIGGVLEKIGLISEGDYGFIDRIDAARRLVVSEFQWRAAKMPPERTHPDIAIGLKRLRPVLAKLLKGRLYVVEDMQALSAPERQTWQFWRRWETGAVLCQMIHQRQQPVGIVGLAKTTPGRWSRAAILLVRLAGRLIADTLPQARTGRAVIKQAPAVAAKSPSALKPQKTPAFIDVEEIEVIIDEADEVRQAGPPSDRMEIHADGESGAAGGLRLFAADGADYQLTCPKCGRQETVAPSIFEKMGAVLRVNCPCQCSFRILREMRHTFRKAVQLDGLFAQDMSHLNKMAVVNVWGPMVVTNISKTGLKFTAEKASLLHLEDRVHLRFYLDNSSKTLIKKSALVKSIRGDTVGCEFLGSDRYDVTLGFYFL